MHIHFLNTGFFKLDGGAMFGIVPRRMWEKLNPPDALNMCTWALRTMLVQTPNGRNILVDTGMGNKQDEKFRSHFSPFEQVDYPTLLAPLGLDCSDITDVFLTHLHFDHCGGALMLDAEGRVVPTFPRATYWSNQRHFDWARQPNERERASFLKENFVPLLEQNRLKFVDVRQNLVFDKGIRLRFFNGHTEAMMGLELTQPDGRELAYFADAMPSQWHLGMPYVMAFDIRPLQVLKEKAILVEKAIKREQIIVLEHDPVRATMQVERDGKRARIKEGI